MKFEPTESDYNEYVELVTPTSSVPRNCLWAFLVGGVICTIGQGIFDLLVHFDVKEDEAYAYVSLTEGEVFGKGVKAFTIAGPVILYGIFTSWLLGVIYWIVSIW